MFVNQFKKMNYRFFLRANLDFGYVNEPTYTDTNTLNNRLLVGYGPAFDMLHCSPKEWLDQLKGPDETDAAFLIHRFASFQGSTFTREKLFEGLDILMRIESGPGTPT